jgi:hypothetical protein
MLDSGRGLNPELPKYEYIIMMVITIMMMIIKIAIIIIILYSLNKCNDKEI